MDCYGNNVYHYDIGVMNWTISSWRQLVKVAPVVALCRRYDIKQVLDLGCGTADVSKVLWANGLRGVKYVGVDISEGAQASVRGDVCGGVPVRSAAFQLVTALDTIQNLPLEKRSLFYKELDRLAGRAGLVYVFFRSSRFESDSDHSRHHIAGEDPDAVREGMKRFDVLYSFGVNNLAVDERRCPFFPVEFSRAFYSMRNPGASKFVGMILRKGV